MGVRRIVRALVLGSLAASPRAAAQSLSLADSLLARGDTAGALATYEALLARDLTNAEAHYRAGTLYMSRHIPGTDLSPNRRKAEEHFRYATRFEGDSAKYWLALAELFRGEDNVFTRMQVPSLVDRGRLAAERAGSTHGVASLEYRAARIDFERWEHFGRRFRVNDPGMTLRPELYFREWDYVEQFFRERASRIPDAGWEPLDNAELHLRAALAADPTHVDAAGLLVVVLGEGDRWPEALEVTRQLTNLQPDSGRGWALHGLVLSRLHRWDEAEGAFDTALTRMTAVQQEPYRDLSYIMRAADRVRFQQLTRAERAALDTTYWRAAQPVALSDVNELRAEFYARLTYVLHRWSDPTRGYRGHETDVGAVYVRYGPPDTWAVFDRSLIAWVYARSRFRFLFSMTPGFARVRFASDSREELRVAVTRSPARFDNIPLYRALDTVLVQTAQFRGADDGTTAVNVFGAIPAGRMLDSVGVTDLEIHTGIVVTDVRGREVGRTRKDDALRGRWSRTRETARAWRLALAPDDYFMRVEALVPALDRAARAAGPLTVRPFGDRTRLMVSDLLAAARVAPRDSSPARWTDFHLLPSAGRFAPGDPIGLLWEIYNLVPDASGVARFTVDLAVTVTAIERRSFAARILGGIGDAAGLSALGDERVDLSYRRSLPVTAAGTVVEHLTLDVQDAPEGEYTITVTVTDAGSGQSATADRAVLIRRDPVTR